MPAHTSHNVRPTDDLAAQFQRLNQRITSLERSSSSGATIPASMPLGFVGYDRATTTLVIASGARRTLGVRVTWTADPTRRYRTMLMISRMDQTVAGPSNNELSICSSSAGTTRLAVAEMSLAVNGRGHLMTWLVESGLSGSVTREGFMEASAGTVNVVANAVEAGSRILVEDIGAA